MSVPRSALRLGDTDNVVVAMRPLSAGTEVAVPSAPAVTVRETIPFGHKVAVHPIAAGGEVIQYDEVIGVASTEIRAGDHVHVHNVDSARLPGATPDPDHAR